jgi:hypothetical protein
LQRRHLLAAVLGLPLLAAAPMAMAQQFGTAAEARAMFDRAIAALRADPAAAVERFNAADGGFRDRDLYVFCFDRTTFMGLVGGTRGQDFRNLRDATGDAFGARIVGSAREGEVTTVTYQFPRPGQTTPSAKESFVQAVGNIGCGVGYYK